MLYVDGPRIHHDNPPQLADAVAGATTISRRHMRDTRGMDHGCRALAALASACVAPEPFSPERLVRELCARIRPPVAPCDVDDVLSAFKGDGAF
jgi:hypothetical protein